MFAIAAVLYISVACKASRLISRMPKGRGLTAGPLRGMDETAPGSPGAVSFFLGITVRGRPGQEPHRRAERPGYLSYPTWSPAAPGACSLIRAASGTGARVGWRQLQGRQPNEIPARLFSVEKTPGANHRTRYPPIVGFGLSLLVRRDPPAAKATKHFEEICRLKLIYFG